MGRKRIAFTFNKRRWKGKVFRPESAEIAWDFKKIDRIRRRIIKSLRSNGRRKVGTRSEKKSFRSGPEIAK